MSNFHKDNGKNNILGKLEILSIKFKVSIGLKFFKRVELQTDLNTDLIKGELEKWSKSNNIYFNIEERKKNIHVSGHAYYDLNAIRSIKILSFSKVTK